jgi:hypothetical protein
MTLWWAKCETQIPPLRCGMTNKKARATAHTEILRFAADSSAALANDKQEGKGNGSY